MSEWELIMTLKCCRRMWFFLIWETVSTLILIVWLSIFVVSWWSNQQMRRNSSMIHWYTPDFTPTCFRNSFPSSWSRNASDATQVISVLWMYMDYNLSSVASCRGMRPMVHNPYSTSTSTTQTCYFDAFGSYFITILFHVCLESCRHAQKKYQLLGVEPATFLIRREAILVKQHDSLRRENMSDLLL
jgi:hypothetical protein